MIFNHYYLWSICTSLKGCLFLFKNQLDVLNEKFVKKIQYVEK